MKLVTPGLNLSLEAICKVFVEVEVGRGCMKIPAGAGHCPSSQHSHPRNRKRPTFNLRTTQAWGEENADHLFFPGALMDHPASWHQHLGYNSLTGCSSLRLHMDHKAEFPLEEEEDDGEIRRVWALSRSSSPWQGELWLHSCSRMPCVLKLLMVHTKKWLLRMAREGHRAEWPTLLKQFYQD